MRMERCSLHGWYYTPDMGETGCVLCAVDPAVREHIDRLEAQVARMREALESRPIVAQYDNAELFIQAYQKWNVQARQFLQSLDTTRIDAERAVVEAAVAYVEKSIEDAADYEYDRLFDAVEKLKEARGDV